MEEDLIINDYHTTIEDGNFNLSEYKKDIHEKTNDTNVLKCLNF